MNAWARVAAVAVACAASGCTPRGEGPVDLRDPTSREWTRLRQHLAIVRGAAPDRPYVEQITIAMREPRTGKVFQARGALAVDPKRALRMILVGPGGSTALDAWVTDARFRFLVPPIELTRRGGAEPSDARGLPVAFFRWWMLHPLDGRILAAWNREGGPVYLLRRGDETVLLRDGRVPYSGRRHVIALRRGPPAGDDRDVDRVEWLGRSPVMPHAGDKARYVDADTGLEVEVLVENVSKEEPDPAAFVDPDTMTAGAGESL